MASSSANQLVEASDVEHGKQTFDSLDVRGSALTGTGGNGRKDDLRHFLLPDVMKQSALSEASSRHLAVSPLFYATLLTHPSENVAHAYDRRRARLFSAISLAMVIASICLVVAVNTHPDDNTTLVAVASIIATLGCIVSYGLSRTVNYMAGVHIAVCVLWFLSLATTVSSIVEEKHAHFSWSNFGSWIYAPIWMLFVSIFCSIPACVVYMLIDVVFLWALAFANNQGIFYVNYLSAYHLVGLATMFGGCLIVQRDVYQLKEEMAASKQGRRSSIKTYRTRMALLSEYMFSEGKFWAAMLWIPSHELSQRGDRRRARVLSFFLLIALVVSIVYAATGLLNDGGVAAALVASIFVCYVLSRSKFLHLAMWLTIITLIGFPYLYRGVMGPKVYESSSLLNLIAQTATALLGCALFNPLEFVFISAIELTLLLWNPFFHPQFALALVLPFVAFVSFLDQRDMKKNKSENADSTEAIDNPMRSRNTSHKAADYDFHGHHVSAKWTYASAAACLVLLFVLVVTSYCDGTSNGKQFTGKALTSSETILHWRFPDAPIIKYYEYPQCRFPDNTTDDNAASHEIANEAVSEGDWCEGNIYSVSFDVKSCSTEGQRYYVTCDKGAFYAYNVQPLCPYSESVALFCVEKDVGKNCRAHIEIGLENFKVWESPTCEFGPNMRFQYTPEAEGSTDEEDESGDEGVSGEPPIFIGDAGITETSTKSSHSTAASFGSQVSTDIPNHFEITNSSDDGSRRRRMIEYIHPSAHFLFHPWRRALSWSSWTLSSTLNLGISAKTVADFNLGNSVTLPSSIVDASSSTTEHCTTSAPATSSLSLVTDSKASSVGRVSAGRRLLTNRRQLGSCTSGSSSGSSSSSSCKSYKNKYCNKPSAKQKKGCDKSKTWCKKYCKNC